MGKKLAFLGAVLILAVWAACTPSAPTPDATGTPDVGATVRAAVATAVAGLPTATPLPTPTQTPNLIPTVRAEISTAIARIPTATPQPTPTPFSLDSVLATLQSQLLRASTMTPAPTSGPATLKHDIVFQRPNGVYDIRRAVTLVENSLGHGSGVLISGTEVLTAYHVVQSGGAPSVTIDGLPFPRQGKIVGYDATRDLALLDIGAASRDVWPAELAGANGVAVPGDSVVSVGFLTEISRDHPSMEFGHVTARWDLLDMRSIALQMDMLLNAGMSGGGVFDTRGQLVGLIRSEHATLKGVSYAIDIETILSALPDLRKGAKR